MIDRNGGFDSGLAQQSGRGIRQVADLRLGTVGHVRAADHRNVLLGQQVGYKVRLRAVNDNRPQTELLRNAQCGKDIVRTVRVKMCLSLAPEKRLQRFHLDVEIRLVLLRIVLRTRLAQEILLRLVQLLADDARGCHARDGRFVLIVVDRLWVLAQRELDRQRRLENHIVHTAACRLEQRNLSADGVCAARADCGSRHTGLKCLAEAAVERVDAVQCTQVRRRRIGVLVAVRALKAETVLVQTDVRVNVDQAGCQHAALAVHDIAVYLNRHCRRFAFAHGRDFAVFEQHPAVKAGILLVHCPNVYIFDQCLIHSEPLSKKLLTYMVIYGIFIMAVGKAAMHRSYLYPHNPTFGALSQGRARFFCAKAGVALLFSTKYAGHASCAAIRPVRAAPFPAPIVWCTRTAQAVRL